MQKKHNPRILIVTPEITYLPEGMGNMAQSLKVKAGGLADVSASLVAALFEQGADIQVALPHYRRMFNIDIGKLISEELRIYKSKLPESRIHLAEDRVFYYRDTVYSNYESESSKFAIAFQREVINNIIPNLKPDLIHCNDWMTGLIPAMARRRNIPCLFTLHNIHTQDQTLASIEDRGIDAAEFWQYLYYKYPPNSYEEVRSNNPVDFLGSGIFAAHYINTVSKKFLREIAEGYHYFIPDRIRYEVTSKVKAGCALGILNSPDPSFNPQKDTYIPFKYSEKDHCENKKANKVVLQRKLGLIQDKNAPLLFWPSRLDPIQKGCQLLTEILYRVISKFYNINLQVLFVANGDYKPYFHQIVRHHDFYDRVAVCDFEEELSHFGYAASDFILMPSFFEPCGLSQMIGCIYGSLPIVFDTGGLHDTIKHLNVKNNTGNGFVFEICNSEGLFWAIDEAIKFYKKPQNIKKHFIERIMTDSLEKFNHSVTARNYIDIYERMLNRPLIGQE